jgi:hypothetical protein
MSCTPPLRTVEGRCCAHSASLPLEIWLHIFSLATDPAHLWTTASQVCRLWHEWIPRVLVDKFVPAKHTQIRFLPDITRPFVQTARFDRFSKTEAMQCTFAFAGGECHCRNGLHEGTHQSSGNIATDGPPSAHVLFLAGLINDTRLVGLQVAPDGRTFSFDARGTLHAFFREGAELQRRSRRWAADLSPRLFAGMMQHGTRHPLATTATLASLYNAHVTLRKHVRRARPTFRATNAHVEGWRLDANAHSYEECILLQWIAECESRHDLIGPFGDAVRQSRP